MHAYESRDLNIDLLHVTGLTLKNQSFRSQIQMGMEVCELTGVHVFVISGSFRSKQCLISAY